MKGRSPRLSAPPLSRGDPPAYRHPPYQGGQGGSNLKSIFNLIITSYLIFREDDEDSWFLLG
ncbi:MAG: hypothetical protein EWV45_02345 [Microcystis flos-aquae Mf_QC_C_20070823_S10D]|uniref:Uncharacterized protein n=2 Tax=Microcystis TaxID=1125 RepID=A0A552L6G3_9CHRO|nr:MAG: hypothetical protein DWQ56_10320 [Microcystis aeruginosa DA14]TRU00906.1 MAG: hypothetical protein EWV65_05630 [Microcystis flos-aquae Ma_QC_C_20070823_S18D]TRV15729.1 MAG: hypothetical protein EWV45_02345 [Microcystis flos-aquae Mf_QC_C_20070823_S10D]TRV28003.1 MAG: hypothetical protein EWV72_03960 [Microcystis flos-aquae Mf_QC_C_20070823_S10]TRV35791.1 MAG: hypothetical protein EWV44_13535 [Microcystis flos-aquae Mf_QC_C_20070823_S20T]TRV40224.1 MAG: hypothetical protein EWV70_01970 